MITLHKPLVGHRKITLLALTLSAVGLGTAQAATCPIPQATDIPPPRNHGGKTFMTSDTAQVEDDGASRLQGNVRLEHGPSSLQADELYFNPNTGIAEVKGNAQFRTPKLQVRADRATVNMNTEEGEFVGTRFAIPESGARGEARHLKSEAGVIGLHTSHYTTCPEDDEFWLLRAKEIELNTNTGWGEAWHSKLRIYDTTVFYLPYIWFPIDDRRQSGILPPSIGTSSDTGLDIAVPYYINLAPNYDATIIPRYMSDRGHQINAEFRYLTEASTGEVGVEYLYKDKQTDEARDLELFRHQGLVTENTALNVNYTRVSDINYYRELNNTLSASAATHQVQRAQFSWQPSRWFAADILASRYQTLSTGIFQADRPYRRLPRIRSQLQTPNVQGLRFELDTEFTRFSHESLLNVDGWRYVVEPTVEYGLDNGAFWWTNRLGLHYTAYDLENTAPGTDASPDRSVPSFSSDFGLRFERLTSDGGLHLFEPRLFYLYAEKEDQAQLPIFDAGSPDFRFDRLFAQNRFLGHDRIADAHHIALAFTNRWLDPLSGAEKTRLSVGQIFRFDDPEVILPGDPRDIDPDRSEVATELAHNFTPHISSALLLLWDNDDSEITRGSMRVRYFDEQERLLAFAYRFRDDILEQTDISFAWPVAESWEVIGRWNYSLMHSENVEAFLGVEYTDCCWGIRIVGRQFIDITETGVEQASGIFVELNLLGLSRFGKNFDRYLDRDTLRSVYE